MTAVMRLEQQTLNCTYPCFSPRHVSSACTDVHTCHAHDCLTTAISSHHSGPACAIQKVACHIHVSLAPALTATRRSGILFSFYFTVSFVSFEGPVLSVCCASGRDVGFISPCFYPCLSLVVQRSNRHRPFSVVSLICLCFAQHLHFFR